MSETSTETRHLTGDLPESNGRQMRDALIDAAAKALPNYYGLGGAPDWEKREYAEEVLTAVLPLVADAIEAQKAEPRRGCLGYAVGNATFNEGLDRAADLVRGLLKGEDE